MTFVMSDKNPVVSWPVKIPVPTDGGAIKEHQVTFKFEIMPSDDIVEGLGNQVFDKESNDKAKAFLVAHTKGWEGVIDEEKNPVEFTEEGFSKLLGYSFFGGAVLQGYIACSQGRKAKN